VSEDLWAGREEEDGQRHREGDGREDVVAAPDAPWHNPFVEGFDATLNVRATVGQATPYLC
jgi:hypothetical protein